MSVNNRSVGHESAVTRDHGWIPNATVIKLRRVVAGYLDGERNVDGDIELLASELATAAHAGSHTPERMLIAVRELWRDFTVSQHDRLQLASLYDSLVRRTIDRYYRVQH